MPSGLGDGSKILQIAELYRQEQDGRVIQVGLVRRPEKESPEFRSRVVFSLRMCMSEGRVTTQDEKDEIEHETYFLRNRSKVIICHLGEEGWKILAVPR